MTTPYNIHQYLPLLESKFTTTTPSEPFNTPTAVSSLLFSKEKTLSHFHSIYLYFKSFFPPIYNDTILRVLALSMKYISIPPLINVFTYGDKKSQLYFILDGECVWFSPQEEILKITEDEYVLYLTKLFFYDEMYLLETVIRENKGMYDISSPYHFEKVVETYLEKFNAIKNDLTLIDFDDLVKYQKESVHRKEFPSFFYSWLTYAKEKEDTVLMNIKTIEEYPKRTVPITIQYDNDEDKKRAEQYLCKDTNVYRYVNKGTLHSGERFNESFTQCSARSATVITNKDTLVGYLSKDFFPMPQVKAFFNVGRTTIINSHPIFHSVNHSTFDKKYMQYFHFDIADKGKFLLTEGDDAKSAYIYFTKKGMFEITHRNNKVGIVEKNGVIGCDDFIDEEGNYAFSVRITSNQGEFYSIKYTDMKKICELDEDVCSNYNNYVSMKSKLFQDKISHLEENKEHITQMKKRDLPYLSTDICKSISQPKKMNRTYIKSFTVEKQKEESYDMHNEIDLIKRRRTLNYTDRTITSINTSGTKLVLRKREQINAVPRPSQRYLTLNANCNDNRICLTDKGVETSMIKNKAVSQKNLPRFVSYKTSSKAESSKNLVRLSNNSKTIRVIDFSQISIGEKTIKPRTKMSLPTKISKRTSFNKFYLLKSTNDFYK